MIEGHVRDDFPYVMLSLPENILRQLEASFCFEEDVQMADGSRRKRPYYELLLDWAEEARLTEVMVLEGVPLLGNALLSGSLLQSEMTDGGTVLIEPL